MNIKMNKVQRVCVSVKRLRFHMWHGGVLLHEMNRIGQY